MPLTQDEVLRAAATWAAREKVRLAAIAAEREQVIAPFAKYVDDPVGFSIEVLGITPWGRRPTMRPEAPTQIDLMLAIRDYDRVAVRSGQKVSKSTTAAIMSLWWCGTRVGGKVTLTAPTGRQLNDILWEEISLIFNGQHPAQVAARFKPRLPGKLLLTAQGGFTLGNGWGITGFSTDRVANVAGFSGADQLVIVDEASGYEERFYAPILGNLAAERCKLVLLSNPLFTSGTFFDAFHGKGDYKVLHYRSTDNPNFHGGHIPGLATPKWEEASRRDWGGPGDPFYDVRVLGEFPKQDSNSIVGMALVEAAHGRFITRPDPCAHLDEGDPTRAATRVAAEVALGPLRAGLDCARSQHGDESVLTLRRGLRAVATYAVRGKDGPMLAAWAVNHIAQHTLFGDPDRILLCLDSVGIGVSCLDAFAHIPTLSDTVQAVGVDSGREADDHVVMAPGSPGKGAKTAKDVYFNLRSQLMFGVAEWLKEGGELDPKHDRLSSDLVVPRYAFTTTNKLRAESKDDIKKRLGRSPDWYDSLALAVYEPPRISYFAIRGPARRETAWVIE